MIIISTTKYKSFSISDKCEFCGTLEGLIYKMKYGRICSVCLAVEFKNKMHDALIYLRDKKTEKLVAQINQVWDKEKINA